MSVITISRQFGSGGDEIAQRICRSLDFHLFDKTMVLRAAADVGLSNQDFLDYSEDNHRVQSFFDRLFHPNAPLITSRYWREDVSGLRVQETVDLSEEQVLTMIQKAVIGAYETGGFVIIGRAGQILLKDLPGVLHVRIESPFEDRIQRVKQWLKQDKGMTFESIETRRAAQDLIETRDAASADYLRRHYGIAWDDPMLYHLVLNTGKLSVEQAVRCIIDLYCQVAPERQAETVREMA